MAGSGFFVGSLVVGDKRTGDERGMKSKRWWVLVGLGIAGLLILGSMRYIRSRDPYTAQAYQIASEYRFRLVQWEIQAIAAELGERFSTKPVDPEALSARTLVLDYLKVGREIGAIKTEMERLAAEDRATNAARLQELQTRLDQLRALQENRRPVVERILVEQVSAVLREEQLGWLGRALPPVAFHFTEPPYYLILSPRDRIELRLGIHLEPELSLAAREYLEERAETELPNTSALVEGIGGFATWPTMVIDSADIRWVVNTIAHEWVHTYLVAYPLGRKYYDSPEMSAINETVADIAGEEIGRKVLARFYPDQLPPTPTPTPAQVRPTVTPTPTPTPTFDFVREMRITRETVDRLLAEGKIAEAEAYMEERRRWFVQHGYYIRKLNQAYFAFYGTYRTGPAAPVDDPIAPRLRRLRERSPTLADFLRTVRDLTSLEELIALVP